MEWAIGNEKLCRHPQALELARNQGMAKTRDVTLYDQVGGQTAIQAIVGNLYERILDDAYLMPSFAQANLSELLMRQVAFVSLALGGPPDPMQRDLQTDQAHADLEIQTRQCEVIARHLLASLHWAGVGEEAANRVLVAVNGLRTEPAS